MSQSPPTSERTVVVPIDNVIPYWRNPRVITDEAVNAVAESLSRYGYQQPIVVDSQYTIIIGHTRYAAMRRLGVTEVEVLIAELPNEQVRQLRVLDNKVREFSLWDFDQLMKELGSLDTDMMQSFFPEVQWLGDPGVTSLEDIPDEVPWDDEQMWEKPSPTTEFVCPSCFHSWLHDVTREEVLSGRIVSDETA